MGKQEDIREGLAEIEQEEYDEDGWLNALANADEILTYLHSQGVVIKGRCTGMSHQNTWQEVFMVEPLVGE